MLERVRTPSSPVKERGRDVEYGLTIAEFLFLKGMKVALAAFSYLVLL